MDAACIAFFLSYCIVIWLHTDAVAEYARLLRIPIFKKKDYFELKDQGYAGNYISFLAEYYSDYFVIRLLKCPICVSVWMGIFCCLFLGISTSLLVGPLTLFFYLVFNKIL